MTTRLIGGRAAWLLAGAAICTADAVVLALLLPAELRVRWFVPLVLVSALLGGGLGLVPGVREVEVAAARSMLGVRGELIVPEHPRPAHRLRSVLLVQAHLLLGALTAAGLVALLPASILLLVEVLRGAEGSMWPLPASPAARAGLGAAALLGIGIGLGLAVPLGALAARLVPLLLGPTAEDRLALALARAAQEAERTRIARDLHDGIGHALTIVSLQAAAGRRVLARDPDAAGEALARIEDTARGALEELDDVLAALREDAPAPAPVAPDRPALADTGALAARIDVLLDSHRRAGMDLRARIALPEGLPALEAQHLERILAELLANAHRHGGPGPVELSIGPEGAQLCIRAVNPLPADAPAPDVRGGCDARGGRGLTGLAERLALFGGALETTAADGRWTARARLPLLPEQP